MHSRYNERESAVAEKFIRTSKSERLQYQKMCI